ncbi:MAG: FtsX-like permease family protein, partial [Pirellulaceae bacterium]
DRVRLTWFQPETTHGEEVETSSEFTVADIVDLTQPTEPWQVERRRRPPLIPPVYEQRPTQANDPWMTPTVPGLTDAESIDNWDLPFDTDNIRPADDDYWNDYRTTPKAFVSMEQGRELWASRFGNTTSFRIPVADNNEQTIAAGLLDQFRADGHLAGMEVVPIRYNGIRASSGATPFDALFLGLSMFVIGSALALVSLLFRLGLQRRLDELGTMLALGFTQKHAGRLWLLELLGVCIAGALLGIALGVGYAALMLWSLRTWLFASVSTPFLNMHINWWTLPLGLLLGVGICVVTIYWSVRAARRQSVRSLLAGQLETTDPAKQSWILRFSRLIAVGCMMLAILLGILAATVLSGDSQAGAFMTSGFLVLVAALVWVYRSLREQNNTNANEVPSLERLARTSASRNPLRSTLTIGLVAVASFLIVAISAFRLAPTQKGAGGFNYVATTSQAVFADLNTFEGQRQVFRGEDVSLDTNSVVVPFRYKSGEDASCNNPYQSTQPQVLGVTRLAELRDAEKDDNNKFSFTMISGENPWRLLEQPPVEGAIPVIIDKNTAWYSLKIYTPGTVFTVDYDSGESVKFQLVGLLDNSVLQGSLLISEENFTRSFPEISGYRYFLMRLKDSDEVNKLSAALSDQGFDATPTRRLLSAYLAVQNTYLSTFQSLGALGLLLGTFGLAAVQLRSVMERRKELGLMRAVGFTKSQLASMILIENAWLLLAGLLIGIGAALVTTLPHYLFGNASIPWAALLGMFAFIAVVGLLTSWLASRSVFKAPLIESLRAA